MTDTQIEAFYRLSFHSYFVISKYNLTGPNYGVTYCERFENVVNLCKKF